MPPLPTTSSNIRGTASLVLAILIFSLQDIAVKWIGGDYSVLEIVMFRSVVALPCTLLFFRYEGGRGVPTTQRYKLEYTRGFSLFLSYTTHFMGLAALPLADIAAIRYSAPLMITFEIGPISKICPNSSCFEIVIITEENAYGVPSLDDVYRASHDPRFRLFKDVGKEILTESPASE